MIIVYLNFYMKKHILLTIAAVLVVGCGESQEDIDNMLISSSSSSNAENVLKAVKKGANVNAKTSTGWSDLRYASMFGHADTAKILIENGANVNEINDSTGSSCLHAAMQGGHLEVSKVLLENGANVNIKGRRFGHTPLDASIFWNRDELTKLLRKHGGKTAEELKAEGK